MPEHINVLPVTETVGCGATVTVIVLAAEHELAVPLTVYTVVAVGDTLMVFVEGPVTHVYVEAPFAVKIVDWPGQIVLVPEIEIVGLGVIVNELVVWEEHVPLAPTTEMEVEEAGFNVNVVPVIPPGVHV